MFYVMQFSTFLLCTVTLASTVLFWASMPTDTMGKIIAAVTATALEACKYVFFPAGFYYLKQKNLGGVLLLVMGVVLLLISVSATTGFLENAYQQQTTTTQQNGIEWKTKKQQLDSYQQQIETLNALIAADAAAKFRTRALEYTKNAKALEEKRNSALLDLQSIREPPSGNAQSLFNVIGNVMHQPPERVRQGAFVGLAAIVDLSAIAALLALSGLRKKNTANITTVKKTTNGNTENQIPAMHLDDFHPPPSVKPMPENENEVKPKVIDLGEYEKGVSQMILARQFGQPIEMRRVISETKLSHAKVTKILGSLIEGNKVRREGKRYFLNI